MRTHDRSIIRNKFIIIFEIDESKDNSHLIKGDENINVPTVNQQSTRTRSDKRSDVTSVRGSRTNLIRFKSYIVRFSVSERYLNSALKKAEPHEKEELVKIYDDIFNERFQKVKHKAR